MKGRYGNLESRLKDGSDMGIKSLPVMLGFFLIGLIIFDYAEVRAEDWKYIGEAYEGKYFYDVNRITRPSKGIVRVWMKVVFTDKGVDCVVKLLGGQFETLSYAIVVYEYHCKNNKKRIFPVVCYSKDEKEVLISLANEKNLNWNFISPDSIDEALYTILCKKPES
jgi:hypothetical protein